MCMYPGSCTSTTQAHLIIQTKYLIYRSGMWKSCSPRVQLYDRTAVCILYSHSYTVQLYLRDISRIHQSSCSHCAAQTTAVAGRGPHASKMQHMRSAATKRSRRLSSLQTLQYATFTQSIHLIRSAIGKTFVHHNTPSLPPP